MIGYARTLFMVIIFIITTLTVPISLAKTTHAPITEDLIELLKNNQDVRQLLDKSLEKAKKENPNPITNPAQSFPEYLNFVDKASTLIPQDILDNPKNLLRDQILQSICYFYFLVDQPLDSLKDKGLYRNTLQYYKPFSAWLMRFAQTWGQFLNTKESWNDNTLKEFAADPRFGLQNDWYESSKNWNSFNRFFSRYLKSPAVRPIAEVDNSSVIVSPADSVPQGVWNIDGNSNIQVNGGLQVKLSKFYSVKDLLGEDSKYKDAFANGTLTHTFLNVFDYHRYHFAVSGVIKEINKIGGNVSLEARWDNEKGKYVPIDSTGWQFAQTRGYVVVETQDFGLVVLMPMGMAVVSSVNFEDDVKVGSTHKKGDMLGTFLFGGSDFVMIFQEKAKFKITAPVRSTKFSETESDYTRAVESFDHILMGQEYGIFTGKKQNEQ